ncbi:MAG TPA: GNVR domain-containing protein [Gemmatimonadales bacterium]|nr:GNVR domain-containing protein [Gemmatimonadales bacterium]
MTATPSSSWYEIARDLVTIVRARWRLVLTYTLIGGAVAVAVVLILPSSYTSTAAFQAESTPQTQLSGALAGLASQLGNVSLSSPQNSPQFFSDLVTTDAVLHRVARAQFPYQGRLTPLSTIYEFDQDAPAMREYRTIKRLRTAIALDVNGRTNVVRVSIEARTPELAQALAESTLAELNEANIELRRARAAAEHDFTADRSAEARRGLDSAELALAAFYQRNRITSSPELQMEESRLKRSVDMAQQIYVQLRMQAEQAGLQEVRNTPVVSVIDPPTLPVRRSWPNRRLGVVLGLAVGFTLSLARLLLTTPRPV